MTDQDVRTAALAAAVRAVDPREALVQAHMTKRTVPDVVLDVAERFERWIRDGSGR